VAWPFCYSGADFMRTHPITQKWTKNSGMHRVRGVKGVHQANVIGLQPYVSRNDPNAALSLLNRLCNRDKHRTLNIVAVHPRRAVYQFLVARAGDPPSLGDEFFEPPFQHDAPMARFAIARESNSEVPVEANVAPTVAFKERPASNMDVGQTLHRLLDAVRLTVLPRFK
jgi:hypothetical protein